MQDRFRTLRAKERKVDCQTRKVEGLTSMVSLSREDQLNVNVKIETRQRDDAAEMKINTSLVVE